LTPVALGPTVALFHRRLPALEAYVSLRPAALVGMLVLLIAPPAAESQRAGREYVLVLREFVARETPGGTLTEPTRKEIAAFSTVGECRLSRSVLTDRLWRELGGKDPIGEIPRLADSPIYTGDSGRVKLMRTLADDMLWVGDQLRYIVECEQ
jgi:hypothetical protein